MHSPPSSPPSSPPQPHTSNDNLDSDENNYYINVHDGSRTLLELPPPKSMDEILSKAVASMNKVRDIDNYEDLIIRMPEIVTNDYTNDNAWEPYGKAKYTQADPSDSSCSAEAGATAAANLQRKPKGKRSGSNNHSKMAWAIVHECFENGMINVKGNIEQIATVSRLTNLTVAQVKQSMSNECKRYRKDYPGLLEKMEISGGIAKQIHDLKEQLHECELKASSQGQVLLNII
ncbi:hypothetical protein BDD12DRAFT_876362 [Trichophaea hybrida]|nr:hypothetical protein BDD12DRAFT_876362 [Trichophaea hybrida]